jgi:serine/threonine protein kinase/uncharacterized protein (DUF433 family)
MPDDLSDDAGQRLIPDRLAADAGRPVVRAAGLGVDEVLRRLAGGGGLEDLRRDHPSLSAADLRACFAYAAEVLAGAPPLPSLPARPAPVAPAAAPPPEAATRTAEAPGAEAPTLAAPAEAVPEPAGRLGIPGYEILGEVGRGGMGVVYRARHRALNRVVALKMILAGEHADAATRARFQAEAEAAAALEHPGIVHIFEVGEHDGRPFLALEYVAGGSLAARLDERPWAAQQAAALVAGLARAVQAAHEQGIVHRDLKPENVLLTGGGQAKVADFGLAKRLEGGQGQTRTGEVLGTPGYMAPEQAAGRAREVGRRTDVYALGAILYRLLTGRPPFRADTPLDTLVQVLEQEPTPVRRLNPAVPRDLETVAHRCLRKAPAERYASAADLADDLQRFLEGEPVRARPLSPPQRLWRWAKRRPGAALVRGLSGLLLLLPSVIAAALAGNLGIALALLLTFSLVIKAFGSASARQLLAGSAAVLCLLGVSYFLLTRLAGDSNLPPPLTWSSARSRYAFANLLAEAVADPTSRQFLCAGTWLFAVPLLLRVTKARLCLAVLGLLLGLLLFGRVQFISALAGAAAGACYGFLGRVASWYFRGNFVDAVCGAVIGTPLGFFVGSIVGAFLLPAVFWTHPFTLAACAWGLALVATVSGAILGAVSSRPKARWSSSD